MDKDADETDYFSYLDEPPTLLDEIEKALQKDNKDEFVNLMNNLRWKEDVPRTTHELLFENDAVKCAAAVLDGETDGKFNLTTDVSHMGDNLFIIAARNRSPRISQLLLDRYLPSDAYLDDSRPLTTVLRVLGNMFRSSVSAYTLLLTLCEYGGGPRLKYMGTLETVRSFAHKTKGINPLYLNYLKEGYMTQVAALLLVASEHLLPSSPPSPDGFFGFKTLAEMNLFLSANKSFTCALHDTRLIENELPILLQIFDKLGDKLAAYVWLGGKDHYPFNLTLTQLIHKAEFYPSTRYIGPCPFRGHSQGSHGWGSVDSETELVGECVNSIHDTAHLMPGWWTRNKMFLPLERKPYRDAALSRRLYHSKPSGNTNLACLAPVKRLTDWRQRCGTQNQFALLAAALKKGLRHV